ncbi:MAG TPA: DsbA family protein, partial [Pseudomonas sp.]|nr:DsbA family protein [Pseudomonas sp.]
MHARLLYVMDPMCSWCWGFAPVLASLAEQAAAHGVSTHLIVGGLRRDRVAIDAAARVRYLGYWQAVNASTGQLFNFEEGLPEGLVYDTEPACRALVTARHLDVDSVRPLAELIQEAFYTEGRDVTQASVLVELAEQAGLPRIEFA